MCIFQQFRLLVFPHNKFPGNLSGNISLLSITCCNLIPVNNTHICEFIYLFFCVISNCLDYIAAILIHGVNINKFGNESKRFFCRLRGNSSQVSFVWQILISPMHCHFSQLQIGFEESVKSQASATNTH